MRRRCWFPRPTRSSIATPSATAGPSSSPRPTLGGSGLSPCPPDSKWVSFTKQDRTLRSHVYIAPTAGGDERHISEDGLMYSETNAVWTADGRYIVFTSAEGFSNGIATQGGIGTTMELWALSLRDLDRDPMNRDIDSEAQGLAAEAAARQTAGGRGAGAGGQAAVPDVRIDWSGLARRAMRLTVPGTTIAGLTPAPEGPAGGGAGFVFARDARTLYFRSGDRLFAANASHTGVTPLPNPARATRETRYPGFDLVLDPSGFYKRRRTRTRSCALSKKANG
jgi:hypothetical protein